MARYYEAITRWLHAVGAAIFGTRAARSAEPSVSPAPIPEVADLPGHFLRGLRKSSWVKDDLVVLEAFLPDRSRPREDGNFEASIDWEDHPGVREFTLKQSTAIAGAARVPKSVVEMVNQKRNSLNAIFVERSPTEKNPHHGDLVFRHTLSKPIERAIADLIVLEAEFIRREPPPQAPTS